MQDIKISQILDDLTRGLTRSPKSTGYNSEIGSIQEKYNLTNKEVNYLFKNEKLKGARVGQPVRINIIDDTEKKDPEQDVSYIESALAEDIHTQEVPNTSGLTADHFKNDWDEEVERANNIRKMANEALNNTQS